MSTLEEVKELVEKLKYCPSLDIHVYFSPIIRMYEALPATEKMELAEYFYKWAKENVANNPLKYSYGLVFMGFACHLSDKHDTALQWITKALKRFEEQGEAEGIGLCSVLMASIYRTFGNFDLALKTGMEAYRILKESGNYNFVLAASTIVLANVNLELQNNEEALLMFNSTYELSEKDNNFYMATYALHGLAKVNMRMHKPDEAKELLEKSLVVAEQHQLPLPLSNSLTELANFYLHTCDYSQAEAFNKRALVMREENNYIGAAASNCINLGEIYMKQSKWEEAIEVLNKGLTLAEQVKVKPKIYQVHLLLSQIYKCKNDPDRSLNHYEIYHELREKVQQEDNARKLIDAKLIFEAEQTKKENAIIKEQKAVIEKKNAELQETIYELTITKVSRKAKAFTLLIAIIFFIFEDTILHAALALLSSDNYYISLMVKIGIIFSLKPINGAIEKYLLMKVLKKKKQEKKEEKKNEEEALGLA